MDPWKIFDLFMQTGATVFGVLAVYLAGKKNKWGFAAGLASQPFWYATTIFHHQWILTIVNIAFTFSWIMGFREWFFGGRTDLPHTAKEPKKSLGMDFRLTKHSETGDTIAEILLDGNVVAAIYPVDYRGIKLISPHMNNPPDYDDGIGVIPPIPVLNISFDPRPYRIQGGVLIRE